MFVFIFQVAENRSEYRLSSEFYYTSNYFGDEGTETKIKNRFNEALRTVLPDCRYYDCKAENIVIQFVKRSKQRRRRPQLWSRRWVNERYFRHKRSPTNSSHASEKEMTDSTEDSEDGFVSASEFARSYLRFDPRVSGKDEKYVSELSEGNVTPEISQNDFRSTLKSSDLTAAPELSENTLTPAKKVSENYLTPDPGLSSNDTTAGQTLSGSVLTTTSRLFKTDFTDGYFATSAPQLSGINSSDVTNISTSYFTTTPKSPNRNRQRNRYQILVLNFDLVINATKTSAEMAKEILTSVVTRTARQLYGYTAGQRDSDTFIQFPLYDYKIYDISVQCPAGFTHAKKYYGRCRKIMSYVTRLLYSL